MPILWRYLLRNYFQVFFLSTGGFIATLLVTRVQEIARLASLTPQFGKILLFTLLQIPYILPMAIPISGLIAAILLTQRLSQDHEFTAFRASGLGLHILATPLLLAALFLSLVNFAIAAELTPWCRHQSQRLLQGAATTHPLFLAQKSKRLLIKDSYVDMKITDFGKEATDFLFAARNQADDRLILLLAKKINVEGETLTGENVTIVSTIAETPLRPDSLVIENQGAVATSRSALTSFVHKGPHRVGVEHLPIKTLIQSFSDPALKTVRRAQFELCRRFFFSLITFVFTLLGFSVGLQIGRQNKNRGVYSAILLASFTFLCAIAAKSFHAAPMKIILLYSLPICVLSFASYRFQKRIARGIE